ncbi:MAG: hypothetical protein EOS07_27735 [Mesorhizobium sp.]|nr:MAG: hypothetical protein EOS07_27735 [Mesorhizobium sp.]
MTYKTVNAEPSNIERYIATYNALEGIAREMAPLPDEAMNAIVEAISVIKAHILASLKTSDERISAKVLAPFIDHLVADGD